MPTDRKEPVLSGPAVDSNDIHTINTAGSRGTGKPPPSRSGPGGPKTVVQKQPSVILWLALVVALAGTVAAGYGLWQQMISQQVMAEQQIRIVELERQLSLADNESSQSLAGLTANLVDLKKQVGLALSEVDKLWATRNVNREAIAGLENKLKANKTETDKILATQSRLTGSVNTLQQKNSQQELLVQSLRERILEQGQSLAALTKDIESSALKDSILGEKVEELTRALKAHDEAIQGFDKFRLTVNRDLLTLKQRSEASLPASKATTRR